MLPFTTISMFLCISYILYCELRNFESIVLTGGAIFATWLLLHFQCPMPWWTIGCVSIGFWDLSLGLLAITTGYRMMFKLWGETASLREAFIGRFAPLCLTIKEIWQDKLYRYTLIILLLLYLYILINPE